jgi:3-deoxy-manno-octulosonate cytidylyltransferase (CMP-KDO synthetase)
VSAEFRVVIPARYSSSRLPGKPLVYIGDKSLIEHVYLSALSSDATEVVIATDDKSIEEAATGFGSKVVMTSSKHESGTDRLAEAINILGYADDVIVVNLQCDEYGLQADLINSVAQSLYLNPKAHMTSLCEKIVDTAVYQDPHSVKVVIDKDNYALYFSRSPIPWVKLAKDIEKMTVLKHIGIYAYHSGFLKKYSGLPRTDIEKQESLEQLRALYHGYKIYLKLIQEKKGIEINTEQDLVRARKAL